MEGGLQQATTAFIAGQCHAQRIRQESGYGKAGCMSHGLKTEGSPTFRIAAGPIAWILGRLLLRIPDEAIFAFPYRRVGF